MEYEESFKIQSCPWRGGEPWSGWQRDRWSQSGHCRAPAAHGEFSGESCEQALATSARKGQTIAAAFPSQPAGASLRMHRA